MTLKLHTSKAAVAVAIALLMVATPASAVAPESPRTLYREGEVLVQYRAGVSPAETQAVKTKLGLFAKRSIAGDRIELLALPAFTTTAAALAVLRADPAVEYAEPNFRRYTRAAIPNDTYFDQQWGLLNTGQANFAVGGPAGIPGADLNMTQAWDGDGDGTAERIGIPSVVVAVIDDAVQTAHPDLSLNIVAGHNFVACQNPNNPNPITSDGAHGTLVSGCIAASGNNLRGVAGVAWDISLMPLKFAYDAATHIEALKFARDHGAHIINASFGGPGFSQVEEDLIASLATNGILYVAAAGNGDSNTDLGQLNYPANYAADNIVAVAATNRQDNIASFSQYGPLTTDVAAPGLQIVTTAIGSSYQTNPGVSGTSFASPYTAGVAALLKSHVTPQPGYLEMKARLIESGSAVTGANPKQKTAGGRIDADTALELTGRPSLVIRQFSFEDVTGNDLPDPGETLSVSFTVRNLWQNAAGVTATLAADNGVTVNSGAQALGDIGPQSEAVATFSISVEPNVTEHRYVTFTLTLSANTGAYSATRSTGVEIGTLTADVLVTQPFADDPYDEFHAWHFDVPAGAGTRTLLIRTGTMAGHDLDLLVKRDLPPQYDITVGIDPEFEPGFFCTSGTASSCLDPDTLVSARQDGVEEVSVVDPPVGSTYHLVVVNFDQQAVDYTVQARLLSGDLRPDAFNFVDVNNIPANTLVTSNEILVTGIDAPSPITVSGGTYNIDGGAFTSVEGTVLPNQRVRVQADSSDSFGRAQLTVGGVTETFYVNLPPPVFFDSGDLRCPGNSNSGGRVPLPLLAGLLFAALTRRLLRTA